MEDTLDALRSLMASHSPPLDGLIIPSEDNHQVSLSDYDLPNRLNSSEYVSDRDKRRAFVSGFTGSAGLALVTMDKALLWTDGRYFLQALQQLSDRWTLMRGGEDLAVEMWISDNLPSEAAIGVDPWCVSIDTAQRWVKAFSKNKKNLVQLSMNLVDEIWKDRPAEKIRPALVQPIEFAGRSVAEKLKDLRGKLAQEKAHGIVVTALDEVAWLYNVRGDDVAYCPVIHAFAIVTLGSTFFYVDERKVSYEVKDHLYENEIEIRKYTEVESDASLLASGDLSSSFPHKDQLEEAEEFCENGTSDSIPNDVVGTTKDEAGKKNQLIWLDPSSCSLALFSKLGPDNVILQQSPLTLVKALKNPIELDGLRKAHVRDGTAVVQYLVWLDYQMQEIYGASGYFLEPNGKNKRKHSESGKLTEVSVSDKLEDFRSKQQHFKGLSFPTISSVGPNAAVIHYIPDVKTCSELDADKIYLFDSGAQYQDGTTDITRTVHFGKPSAHEKACYTAVLKGHIALDTATFPSGTTGHALDILARIPLWNDGLDYRHGTGHGIGSYLNVHEGPQLISFRPSARNVALQPSMTVTDEPGYYEDGNFGIRLENVLVVKEADTKFNFGEKGYLTFEHITWAPYQKKLINLSLLTPAEVEWVDNYHSACRDVLAPYLNENELLWLKKATEPLSA